MGYELRLQLRSRRSWILLGATVAAVGALYLADETIIQAGIAPVAGFDFVRSIVNLVFFAFLPLLAVFESAFQMGREYSQRTLTLFAFAGVRRARVVRTKIGVVFGRCLLYAAVAAGLTLGLAERFGMDSYPLFEGALARGEMYLRFFWIIGHSLLYTLSLVCLTTGMVVLLRGRRFEAIGICLLLFLLLLFTGGVRGVFPSWWLVGVPSELFENLGTEGVRGSLFLGESMLGLLDAVLFFGVQVVFRRHDIRFHEST